MKDINYWNKNKIELAKEITYLTKELLHVREICVEMTSSVRFIYFNYKYI